MLCVSSDVFFSRNEAGIKARRVCSHHRVTCRPMLRFQINVGDTVTPEMRDQIMALGERAKAAEGEVEKLQMKYEGALVIGDGFRLDSERAQQELKEAREEIKASIARLSSKSEETLDDLIRCVQKAKEEAPETELKLTKERLETLESKYQVLKVKFNTMLDRLKALIVEHNRTLEHLAICEKELNAIEVLDSLGKRQRF